MTFRRGSADADSLATTIQEILGELGERGAGVGVTVTEPEHGADASLTTILITIAGGVGVNVLTSLWETEILPRVRRRLGDDALEDPPE